MTIGYDSLRFLRESPKSFSRLENEATDDYEEEEEQSRKKFQFDEKFTMVVVVGLIV